MDTGRIYDLEERLVNYACLMIEVVRALPNDRIGNHFAGQLVRSSTSPALNYGEAQAAESNADFVYKLCVVLKELKECRVCLKVIMKTALIQVFSLARHYKETEELVAIIGKSISTARKKAKLPS
ncbi:MAG: four helix bundle protein [Sphingobacteriales bacterium]|nr:MAG: four helix bundle protein [Sphingobacteriales bacterium]